MEKTPLEQVGIRIDAGEDLKKADIQAAFKDEQEYIINRYDRLKKSTGDQADRVHNEKIEDLKQSELITLKALKERYERVGISILSNHRRSRERLQIAEGLTEKTATFAQARSYANELTDPFKKDAIINDYENWGYFWQNAKISQGANNKTRYTLSGLVMAYKVEGDENGAIAKMHEAKRIHDDYSWINDALMYSDLMTKMSISKYLVHFDRNRLAPETEGLIAGLMMIAEEKLGDQTDPYKQYLVEKISRMYPQLSYTPKGDAKLYAYNKGAHQLNVLSQLVLPSEWEKYNKTAREGFRKMVVTAANASEALNYEYKNPDIRYFLARDPATINNNDRESIKQCFELIRDELKNELINRKYEILRNSDAKTAEELENINFNEAGSISELLHLNDKMLSTKPNSVMVDEVTIVGEKNPEEAEKEKEIVKDEKEAVKATKTNGKAKAATKETEKENEATSALPEMKESEKFKEGDTIIVKKETKPRIYDDRGKLVGQLDPLDKLVVAEGKNERVLYGLKYVKAKTNDKEVWIFVDAVEKAGVSKEVSDSFLTQNNLIETQKDGNYIYVIGAPLKTNGRFFSRLKFGNSEVQKAWDYFMDFAEKKSRSAGKSIIDIDEVYEYSNSENASHKLENDDKNIQKMASILAKANANARLEFDHKP
ncbi:hypothetical protein GF340_02300, partial [Candidatus Peregrinibacteria bacterium]|nr:hypothetical protein [Candidatus Peregrinibacteria bacterium]